MTQPQDTPTPDPMKTPEQWLEALDCVPDLLAEDVSAIQSDARADLLEQNRRMREILDIIPHGYYEDTNGAHLHASNCLRCRWESLKKEMGI